MTHAYSQLSRWFPSQHRQEQQRRYSSSNLATFQNDHLGNTKGLTAIQMNLYSCSQDFFGQDNTTSFVKICANRKQ